MAGPFKARQIIEEDQFQEEKIRISRSVKRLDDVLFGITWVLARKPESFERIGSLGLYLAKTDAVPRVFRLSISGFGSMMTKYIC